MCDCDVVGLMQTLCTWVGGIVSLMVCVGDLLRVAVTG